MSTETTMNESLVDASMMFRFAVPMQQRRGAWKDGGIKLSEKCVLPTFSELQGRKLFADLRGAWNHHGLFFTLDVRGKKQAPWCRSTRPEDSDGLQLLIDTRCTQNIHRASRFCHRFILLPEGGGRSKNRPVGELVEINRAREQPRPIAAAQIKLRSERKHDGYRLEAFLPADVLTGFEPGETPRLGFSYVVVDRELGWQVLTVGPELPVLEDPSLWSVLELVA